MIARQRRGAAVARFVGVAAVAVTLGGCASVGGPRSPAASAPALSDVARLEARIAELRERFGFAAPPPARVSIDPMGRAPRCQTMAAAAGEICSCADRICALAERLADQPSRSSCDRAREDCRRARAHAEGCK